MTKTIRPIINFTWLGTVDQGKQLEFSATIDDVVYSLATIVADDTDESLWFEIYIDGKIIQIPIEKVREALDSASGEVHSEKWYEQNVYSRISST